MSADVQCGIDQLVAEDFASLNGRSVGLIANQTTVDRGMRHLADLLHQSPAVNLRSLFGPEHGVRGDAQDMIGVSSDIDRRTRLPVHSLYGSDPASLRPRAEHLEGLDLLIFDVQDVGSRYYTFAATMAYAMEAAARAGIGFLVLDRPNPIGGELIEGPSIDRGFESFCGFHPIPTRHGLTVGELARLVCDELRLDLDLAVLACTNWRRSMSWQDTNLPWINPSPNMPSEKTALVYPGGCLIEGTNLSEGRGTTRPFEYWGAPWLDGDLLASRTRELLGEYAAGVLFRPHVFTPTFHKHAGSPCAGVEPVVIDASQFRPLATYTAFLAAAREQDPTSFAWRTDAYEFVSDRPAIDLLFGSSRERELLEAGLTRGGLQSLIENVWRKDERAFRERRIQYLLYPEADW